MKKPSGLFIDAAKFREKIGKKSHTEFAKANNLTQSSVSNWARGGAISQISLNNLCHVFRCSEKALLKGEEVIPEAIPKEDVDAEVSISMGHPMLGKRVVVVARQGEPLYVGTMIYADAGSVVIGGVVATGDPLRGIVETGKCVPNTNIRYPSTTYAFPLSRITEVLLIKEN